MTGIYGILIAFFIYSFPVLVFGQNINNLTPPNPYTFTLKNAAQTSAGVYTVNGTLIKTLWTLVKYEAGTYNITWDGKDDSGTAMPAGNYIIKVASNNVKYNWEGIIGNTSTKQTGSSVHRGFYYFMTGMTIVNNAAYYCSGYSEARPSVFKFLTAKPQEKLNIESHTTTTANTDIVVNDGKTVYWAGSDPYAPATANVSWVFGTNVSDDSDVFFTKGTVYKPLNARQYNTIGLLTQANSLITGLAVQKAGNYLFIARAGVNTLYVLNKTTGALVQTISINSPKALCTDINDNLWMVSNGNSISKYSVKADGTLSAPILTISNTIQPIALAVSPDNSTVTVADGDISSQQIKAYSNVTSNLLWTLGDAGGYMQSPTVTNNKFYFNDIRGKMYAEGAAGFLVFIAFQPDGSFWVNDPGNYRVQHYDANRNFIENIMSLGPSYSSWADRNDLTRVGSEYLEFKIDNKQVISGSTGWTFVKNWGATVSSKYDQFSKFKYINTFTDNNNVSRTFGYLRNAGVNNDVLYEIVELPTGDKPLRFTGIIKPVSIIDKSGAIITNDLKRYAFKGFDSSNNPVWSTSADTLADISKLTDVGPLPLEGFRNDVVTSNKKIIFYNYSTDHSTGFHLGAIQKGDNKWLWETAKATVTSYSGPFPDPSHFDIGNTVNNYAGSVAMVLDSNIITGYHGEFWKAGQTNKYNHYLDNGLAIGQFGTAKGEFVDDEAPAMMAGNTLTPQLTNGANDDELNLWHGDESFHAGLHKWRITGLKTIAVQNIPIIYPLTLTFLAQTPAPGIDLMQGLTYNNIVKDSLGWTRNNIENYTDINSNYWSVKSGAKSYNNIDVFIQYRQNSGVYTVLRDLGKSTKLTSWTLSGILNMENNTGNAQNGGGGSYIEILDDAGKIISRFYNVETYTNSTDRVSHIYANDQTIAADSINNMRLITQSSQPLEIHYENGKIGFKYANFNLAITSKSQDPQANPANPTTFRVYFWTSNTGENYSRVIDLQALKFTANKADQTISFNSITSKQNGPVPYILTATSTSNLPVSYTVVSGPATISGNSITIIGAGTVVIKADQAGNNIYNAASPVTQSFIVNPTTIRVDL